MKTTPSSTIRLLALGALGCSLLILPGCNDSAPPPPQSIDAPLLASSLKWLGVCGVLCSVCGATGLIIASRNRRK